MAKEKQLSSLDRAIQQAMGENRTVGLEDDPAKQMYPQLWDWLSRIYVGRDYIKQPAVITIALTPGGVSARLVDRDMSVLVEATCPYMDGILGALEKNLISENPGFKNFGKREPGLRKRKKST